jgi:hypothetical protein
MVVGLSIVVVLSDSGVKEVVVGPRHQQSCNLSLAVGAVICGFEIEQAAEVVDVAIAGPHNNAGRDIR